MLIFALPNGTIINTSFLKIIIEWNLRKLLRFMLCGKKLRIGLLVHQRGMFKVKTNGKSARRFHRTSVIITLKSLDKNFAQV